jgi:SAM-dependent methyltransferase
MPRGKDTVFLDSYIRHQDEENALAAHEDLPWRYTKPNSIGNYHHERMLRSIEPILRHSKLTTWMTVGDGRFGSDANFLRPYVARATATSISGSTLEIAQQKGWIDSYSAENAEQLSFADNSFDFVFCKETYHHFPRPAIGFYEMLRVARIAVVLIEPMEGGWTPLLSLKRVIKKFLRRDDTYDQFEPSGNFVYRINVNDIFKSLAALGYSALAWKGRNTFWHEPFDTGTAGQISIAWLGTKIGIMAQDLACRVHLLSPGIVTAVCFKNVPDAGMLGDLRSAGYRIKACPVNPYIV